MGAAFSSAAGESVPPCLECGDTRVPGLNFVVLNLGEILNECSECGRFRTAAGELVGGKNRDGIYDGRFTAIHLRPPLDNE